MWVGVVTPLPGDNSSEPTTCRRGAPNAPAPQSVRHHRSGSTPDRGTDMRLGLPNPLAGKHYVGCFNRWMDLPIVKTLHRLGLHVEAEQLKWIYCEGSTSDNSTTYVGPPFNLV